jgi:hypothetical protein
MNATGAPNPGTRDYFVRSITHKVLAMAVEELRKDETQQHVRQHVVDPLIKMLHTQLMPYVLLAAIVVIAILLMSMMTLTLSALFYFRRA